MLNKWISQAGLAFSLIGLCATVALATPPTDTGQPHPVIAGHTAPPALARFVTEGWRSAPEHAAAVAAVAAAEARLEAAARPLYNPELSLEAERGEVDTKTIGLSQTMDLGGKRPLKKQAAELALAASRADRIESRQRFAADLLENLARYQSARSLYKLARQRTDLMERFADTAEKRLAAGDIGPLDAALAKVAYTNARIAQAGAQRQLSQSAAALRAVTGTDPASWPELPAELPGVRSDFPLQTVIDQLPVMRAMDARAKALSVDARQVDRERIPDPTFGLTGGREGQENLIGLSLSFPLPVRNNLRAEARAASEEAIRAQQEVLQQRRAATARIEGAVDAYRVVREAWDVWQQSGRQSLIEQVTLLERMWEAGDISASDYLLQAGQNVDTQAAATELAGEVWSAALELLHVTGSLDAWLTAPSSAAR